MTTNPQELLPCPFCGGKFELVTCDDEGNRRGDDYADDPWSGLGYQLSHDDETNPDCPIASHADDGGIVGTNIYSDRKSAIKACNTRRKASANGN